MEGFILMSEYDRQAVITLFKSQKIHGAHDEI